jgi:hypothetical protein
MITILLTKPYLFGTITTDEWIDLLSSHTSRDPNSGPDEIVNKRREHNLYSVCVNVLEVHLSTLHSNLSPLFATQVQLYCLASLPRIRHSQSDRPDQENKASGSDTKSEALFKLSHYFLNHSCCLGQFESHKSLVLSALYCCQKVDLFYFLKWLLRKTVLY